MSVSVSVASSRSPKRLMKGMLLERPDGDDFDIDESSIAIEGAEGLFFGESADAVAVTAPDEIDFLLDDPSEMTWGRRIALSLMDKSWYNPSVAAAVNITEDEDEIFMDAQQHDDRYHTERYHLPIEQSIQTGSPTLSPEGESAFDRMKTDPANLKRAWGYFEHVALDRYIVEEKKQAPKKNICHRMVRKAFLKGNKKLERAEPGENDIKTRLYSPIFTPHKQLGDFGLGIGLYFSTVRAIAFITLFLGLVSSYNIKYFSSDSYMPDDAREIISNTLLHGSAICTNTPWVPCPDCICTTDRRYDKGELLSNRCGILHQDGQNTGLVVALKNECDGTSQDLGFINYTTVILLLIATLGLGEYLRRQEVQFDEDEQTAQDYSIRITNPPTDATNPDEWRQFFLDNCDGAQATVCTVAVDNDLLVRTLVERREVMRTIQNTLEPGSLITDLKLAYMAAKTERERSWMGRILAIVAPGIPEYYAKYVAMSAKVQGLAQLDFPVTNVFVTFETEKDQRKVLSKLSVGSLKASRNDVTAVSDPKFLFRGQHVLAVEEPDEPSTVRWQDLNAGFLQKLKEQCLTTFATACAIFAVAVIVRIANEASTAGAAFAIAAFNSVFPILAKLLTELEAHAAEGEKQTSLYFKIAAFRWVNTAFVITIVTPFTDTLALEKGIIPQIYALFFAEILTVSGLQLADPAGHFNRHFLAPRALTQDAMNLKFQGAPWELAERYTDATKLLFLCVWYCSIFPGSFFLCSFALFVKYFIDRFSLMRTWKRPPQLGTRVSKFSRRYFFSLAVVAMAIMSSFYWSGFPYDNLCESLDFDNTTYAGTFTVHAMEKDVRGHLEKVSFNDDVMHYRVCSQNLLSRHIENSFPFIPKNQPKGDEWMTSDQEKVTEVFGWTAVAITILVVAKFVWGWIEMFQSLFRSSYSAVGDDQNIPFSEVASRSAYIPQVYSSLFSYPLIACDTEGLDEELYDWEDPDRSYDWYDLKKDANHLLSGLDVSANVGFTKVKHYPPKLE